MGIPLILLICLRHLEPPDLNLSYCYHHQLPELPVEDSDHCRLRPVGSDHSDWDFERYCSHFADFHLALSLNNLIREY